MEREIKFRAWDKEFKRWSDSPLNYCMKYINNYTDYEWNQFTGLKDINGREIYEKDIVFCQSGFHKYKTVVRIGEYSQDGSGNEYESITCCGVYGEESRDSHGRYVPASSINNNESVEVIGNIFENPELLEGMQ